MRAIITGGGTGGHLFPGIALATALQQCQGGCDILFIGTKRQLDQDTLAGLGFERASVNCLGLKGKGMLHRLKSLATLPLAVIQAARIIRGFRPDIVVGVGGYVTGPVLLAARLLSVPGCIHEQNSVPGLANRMISRFIDRVFISIPGPDFPPKKTVLTGNPVREEILLAAEQKRDGTTESKTLLVLGGSLGAHRINELMVQAMAIIMQQDGNDVQLIHQTGSGDVDMVKNGYKDLGVEAEVAPFFTDMAQLYSQADCVVARAGATTLAELAVMGVAALLIPYPHAADDHQAKNAQYYTRAGGAVMIRERELDGERLASIIQEFLGNDEKRSAMADKMRAMARPDATRQIVTECLQMIGEK